VIDAHIQLVLDQLESSAHEVGAAMADAIMREVAPIGAVARHDRQFTERFVLHCEQHVRVFANTTRQDRLAQARDLEFVREVGTRRAEDALPIAALLEGLRVGHRVLSQRIADIEVSQPRAALWLVRKSIDYMDAASRVLTDSYLARQQLVMGRSELVRRQLLDDLLEGRYAARADAADVATAQGFEPDEQYCVAVLACRGIAETPRGYWEAVRALRVATAEQPCVDLRRLGLLRYLASSADSVAQRLAAQAAGPVVRNDSERMTALADTLLAYADCAGNASETAAHLQVHLNTVHNRLERVAALLERPTLGPIDVVELAAAIRICRAHAPR
jgi:PucR C-terminal helix-turn-helix domain